MSKHKVHSKNIAIVILDVILLLAAIYLPNSSFSQVPTPRFISGSHNNITNSNNTIIHANKSLSSQGTNSYSYSLNNNNNNKLPNIQKPKSSLSTLETKLTDVTTNLSYKRADKFGIKEIYPTKK
ncbi:MAG TPA: hypothetical protein VFJ05_00185 [Nitrososphaeraceae archaeon]|nr:hypothetical protein [Nitrososphaeraceae archaeon]